MRKNNHARGLYSAHQRYSIRCAAIAGMYFILMMTGCEDLSDKKLLTVPKDLIVVAGNITSENKNHLITLTLPYQALNGTGAPLSGALITLAADGVSIPLSETPAGSGMYYTPVLRAITGKVYTLTVNYRDKTFTASDTPPAVEGMNRLTLQRIDSLYTFSEGPSGTAANFVRHAVVWQDTPYCKSGDLCAAEIYYYDLKTADVNDIFKPDKTGFYFPPGSTIIRTKYSVSAAYRSYLRSMLSETEWSGGVFDVQHAPVETNLSAGAIGFFAVSTVLSDTTVVK